MAGYTSWGTRKALGRRYSIDPAYQLESERLQQEYALAPSREAAATQASQFAQTLAFNQEQAGLNRQTQEDANAQAGKSAMMGTIGNAITTAGTLRALTLGKGEPFFGNLFSSGTTPVTNVGTGAYTAGSSAPLSYTPIVADSTLGGGVVAGGMGAGGAGAGGAGVGAGTSAFPAYAAGETVPLSTTPFTVNPALMGEGASAGVGAGAETAGASAAGAAAGSVAQTGITSGTSSAGEVAGMSGLSFAAPAAAGYAAPGLASAAWNGLTGGTDAMSNLGRNLTGGLVNDKTTGNYIGSIATGAAAGAAVGSFIPVVGTAVGAVVGGVFGAISAATGTWICTEIGKKYGLSDEENKLLSKLRRFTVKNHREDAEAYLKNGHRLVTAIKDDSIYAPLKEELVDVCCDLVKSGDLEGAYKHYKQIMLGLCEQYSVDLYGGE